MRGRPPSSAPMRPPPCAALPVQCALHHDLAAAPGELGRAGHPRQPIAPGVRRLDRELARERRAAELAVEGPGEARAAHRRPADDPLRLARDDADRQALRPDDLAPEVRLAARDEVDVVRACRDVERLQAVGRLGAGDLEARLRSQHVLVAGEQPRGRQGDLPVRLTGLRRPGALRLQRREVAAAAADFEAALAGGAGGAGLDQERLVGRQAQRAGHRAALGLAGVQGEPDGLVAAEIERGVQAIAGVDQAGGVDVTGHAAPAAKLEPAVHVIKPVAGRKRRQQLDARGELVDGHGHRRAAARRGPLWSRGPQHRHQAGVERPHGQPAAEQLSPIPPHTNAPGVEPGPVVVADRQSSDREIAPDVAAQPLDVQAAVAPDVDAIEHRLDESEAGRRQHAEAQQDRGHAHQADQRHDRDGGPASAAPAASPRRGRLVLGRGLVLRRRLAQKLCPMLM